MENDLISEIEQRRTTLDLGLYDNATGERYSLLGSVGQALAAAAKAASDPRDEPLPVDDWALLDELLGDASA